MSHHYSGPNFGFPMGTPASILLTYTPSKPGDAGKSILIMNAHPSVGVNPPGPTTVEPFAPEAIYELEIDTNSDAVADVALPGAILVRHGPGTDCDIAPC